MSLIVLAICAAVAFSSSALLAKEKAEAGKAGEWTVTIGCQKCNFKDETSATKCGPAAKTADGKVVILKGKAMKAIKFKEGGEYLVKGTMSQDGKEIAVSEISPKKES